ncbi:MAG: hypothetical protein ACYC3S_03790 [Chloroflexota bacterium]
MGIVEAFIPVGLVMLGVGAVAGVSMGIRVLVVKLSGLSQKPAPVLERVSRQ